MWQINLPSEYRQELLKLAAKGHNFCSFSHITNDGQRFSGLLIKNVYTRQSQKAIDFFKAGKRAIKGLRVEGEV